MTTTPTPAPVPQVALSADGPTLSAVVAGMWRMASWQLDVPARVRWIEACLELGITSFDHADIYGDYQVETLFGEALAAAPGLRDRIQLVTKCGIRLVSAHRPAHARKSYDTSSAHVLASVERSLRALHTDRIELLLLHRPDPLMDPDALAETFRALRESGTVLHVGVSNHAPSQLALLHGRHPVVTNQVELSPLSLGTLFDGTLDHCQRLRVRPMIWSPLAGGRLFTGDDAVAERVRTALTGLASQHGVSAPTLAYAWILRHPSQPLPIVGSRRSEALDEAVRALSLQLDRQGWYEVLEAATGKNVP